MSSSTDSTVTWRSKTQSTSISAAPKPWRAPGRGEHSPRQSRLSAYGERSASSARCIASDAAACERSCGTGVASAQNESKNGTACAVSSSMMCEATEFLIA